VADTTPNEGGSSDEVQTTQQAQQALAIASLPPESGAPGATEGIYCAGFGPSPSDNAVTFSSARVPVDSAKASGRFAVVTGADSPFSAIGAGLTGVSDGSASWGDYDSDRDLDLAVTGSGTAKIYRNEGGGNFQAIGAGLARASVSSASWGDYDSDGDLDLAVTGRDSNFDPRAFIYRNEGGGNFQPIGAGLTGVVFGSTSWGDYDSDGDPDLAVTGRDSFGDQTAKIYRNEGGGNFQAIGADLTRVDLGSTSWGDFDGDSDLDLAVTGRTSNSNETAKIYRNEGGGNFQAIGAGLTGVGNGSASWGDYDSDGDPDLAVTGSNPAGFPTAKIYRNEGGGSFQAIGASLTEVKDGSTSWGDFDGDSDLDLAVTGEDSNGDPTTKIYRNEGGGNFQAIGAGLTWVDESSITWGDYDSDGDPDLAVTGEDSNDDQTAKIYRNGDPIPVELSGFDATLDGDDAVRLTWTTASETGNAGFRVQRKVEDESGEDEGTWTTVGSMEGAGTTSEPQSYRYDDADLPYDADRLSYRLRQVDIDGTTTPSDPVVVERGVDAVELLGTFPNPTSQQATVRYALPAQQDIKIRLYDALGRQVRTVVNAQKEGRHAARVDLSGLPSGTYFLRLQAESATKSQQVTVVR
jgi:predicted nucleotidyltransferase